MRVFQEGLEAILKDQLVGLYVYGALTFLDSQHAVRDIDYHVVVRRALDDSLRQRLWRLNGEVLQLAAGFELDLDGYIIALDDMRHTAPPRHQIWPLVRAFPSDTSWALHCAHIRAGHVITLCGPDPIGLYPEPSWPDIAAALYSEIRFVEHVLETNPAYAVLNACRLLYSFETRNVVVSKRAAAAWARAHLSSEVHPLIDTALTTYEAGSSIDHSPLTEGTREFVDAIWQRIAQAAL